MPFSCTGVGLDCAIMPNPFDNIDENMPYGLARVCVATTADQSGALFPAMPESSRLSCRCVRVARLRMRQAMACYLFVHQSQVPATQVARFMSASLHLAHPRVS